MKTEKILRYALLGLALTAPLELRGANSVSNTVTGATFTNLTDAVAALSTDGNTLILSSGTYTEPEEILILYAVTIQGENKETVIIQPASSASEASNRIARVNIVADWKVSDPVVFEQLTLRNGNSSGDGGALYVQEGMLTVRDCNITANQSANGGGLAAAATAAILTAEQCVFSSNSVSGNGGAILRGRATDCLFYGNSAANGGAAAYAELSAGTVSNNTASAQGGGLFNGTADRIVLKSNQAPFGGGAYNTAITNSLLKANSAAQSGGALYDGSAVNCTVLENTAQTAGGGICNGTAANSIFHGNQAPSGSDYSASSLAYCRAEPLAGGTGNITDEPLFRAPDEENYTLLSYSPCVNSGQNSVAAGTDLNGNARIQDTTVDMGAYEHDPAVVDYQGFQAWLERRGLPTDVDTQFDADHDNDGIPNGLAYAFGENRVNGTLLTIRQTDQGPVAETAVRSTDSLGFINVDVIVADSLDVSAEWSPAESVAGAPEGAARYKHPNYESVDCGFFRLRATLP